MVALKPYRRRVSVVVKGDRAIRYEDVISGEAIRRPDPEGTEGTLPFVEEKDASENVAGTVAEECPVAPVPSA